MKPSLAAALIVMVTAAASSGCDEQWGNHLKNFVNSEARPLSIEHAQADFRDRWAAAHQAQSLSTLSQGRYLAEQLAMLQAPKASSVDLPTPHDERTLAQALLMIETSLSRLLWLQFQLERIEMARKLWEGVCDSRLVFEETGMNQVSIPDIAYGSLPTPDYGGEVHSNPIELLIDGVNGLWRNLNAHSVDEQNQKAREASEIFHSVIIQGDELFSLSKRICKEEAQAFSSFQNETAMRYEALGRAISHSRAAFQVEKYLVEAKLTPLELKNFMKSDGTLGFLADQQAKRERADRSIDLQRMRIAVNRAARAVNQAADCELRLSAVEDLEDLLIAHLSQIEFELQQLGAGPETDDLRSQLRTVQAEFQSKLSAVREQIRSFHVDTTTGGCP